MGLPDEYQNVRLHPLCIKPSKSDDKDDVIYRMGNQKYAMATMMPPSVGNFIIMSYVSKEDKSL